MDFLRALATNFDDVRVLLLYYCGEASLLAYVGLGLIGIKIEGKNILKIGLLHGIAVFLIRAVYKTAGIPFGTHTLILVFVLASLIFWIGRITFGIALSGAMLGMVTLILGESLVLPHFHKIIGIPLETIWANTWTHIMAGYVGDILLIFTAVLVILTNFSLIRVRD